jgi:hypothetical protein
MNSYQAFEYLVIGLLMLISLRAVWRRVLKPLMVRNTPAKACGSGGCNGCTPAAKH